MPVLRRPGDQPDPEESAVSAYYNEHDQRAVALVKKKSPRAKRE